jgi:hypothetical protein
MERRAHEFGKSIRDITDRETSAGFRNNFERAGLEAFDGECAALWRYRTTHNRGHWMELHQLLEEGESIHARHFDVENDAIWLELQDFLARSERIGGGSDDLEPRLTRQLCLEDLTHDCAVIDDQHARNARGNSIGRLRVSCP